MLFGSRPLIVCCVTGALLALRIFDLLKDRPRDSVEQTGGCKHRFSAHYPAVRRPTSSWDIDSTSAAARDGTYGRWVLRKGIILQSIFIPLCPLHHSLAQNTTITRHNVQRHRISRLLLATLCLYSNIQSFYGRTAAHATSVPFGVDSACNADKVLKSLRSTMCRHHRRRRTRSRACIYL